MALNSAEAVDFVASVSDPVVRDLLFLVHDTWFQRAVMAVDQRSTRFDQLFFYKVLFHTFSHADTLCQALKGQLEIKKPVTYEHRNFLKKDRAVERKDRSADMASCQVLGLFEESIAYCLGEGWSPEGEFDLEFAFEIVLSSFMRKEDVKKALRGSLQSEVWDWLR